MKNSQDLGNQQIASFLKKKKIFFFFSSPLPPILQLNYSGSLETGGVSITFLGWGGVLEGDKREKSGVVEREEYIRLQKASSCP